MRKSILSSNPEHSSSSSDQWLNLEELASIEVSSEDPLYPFEDALHGATLLRKDSAMRSSQVYRALDLVPNRYTLCQTISQSARRIHVNGNPFESTVTAILMGIGDGSFHCRTQACLDRDDSNGASHNALLVS